MNVITVRTYHGGQACERDGAADIAGLVAGDDGLVWVDLVDPDEDDLACIQQQFELHPLAPEDVRKHHQRPKLEPELRWRFGYPFALALMASVTFFGFRYFRRRDWL